MHVFWQHGYEGTSLSELVEQLGVGRQSLYDTFGDKHALYLAALDRYRQIHGNSAFGALDEGPVRKGIRSVFMALVDWLCSNDEGLSCMLVAAAAERCPVDKGVEARFCENLSAMEARFAKRLARARDAGEIGSHHDPAALASYLANALTGLQLTAKAVRDRQRLERIVDVTLSVLG